ncbi:MAG: competence/damage-inducible protein A [Chitinophagales bacterium]|nr:competence/damage-inducible protein A [Chitinophagales bacterium]
MKVLATIVTIGDELLIGQTIDTNSAWIGQEMNKIGVQILRRISVGDDAEQIKYALREAAKSSSLVIITGGLGPTKDDVTKRAIAEFFGAELVFHENLWQRIAAIFEKRGKAVLEMNKSQAMIPANATIISNDLGTAQGMWFDEEGIVYISVPGVPHEMKHTIDKAIKMIQQRFLLPKILHKTLMTAGAGESSIANILREFENNLPSFVKLAYLPELGVVKLRLSAYLNAQQDFNMEAKVEEMKKLLGEYVYSDEEISLHEAIGRMLKRINATLAVAESCTGGYLAHLITSVPGSSSYFLGGIVSYHNDVKTNLLQVKKETLFSHGAVSEATVEEMVKGVLHQTGADYAIATSGVAGPDGGTPQKPVGTVCIAVGDKNKINSQKFHFFPSRMENIKVSTNVALNMLRKFILQTRQEFKTTSLSQL